MDLSWVVGLLWDDLYDWHQWFLRARLAPLRNKTNAKANTNTNTKTKTNAKANTNTNTNTNAKAKTNTTVSKAPNNANTNPIANITTGANVATNGSEAGLICLGSNAVDGFHDYSPNTINAARMESGLDNSPM
jgi:hypothetical protein